MRTASLSSTQVSTSLVRQFVSSYSLVSTHAAQQEVTFTLPKSLPSGQYLLRLEQIALHVAGTYQGAQVSHGIFIERVGVSQRIDGIYSFTSAALKLTSSMVVAEVLQLVNHLRRLEPFP